MSKNHKRVRSPLLAVASAAAVGLLLAGCSSGSGRASAGAGPSSSSSSGSSSAPSASSSSSSSSGGANSLFEQALAYSKCMRANGVTAFPDPKQDGQGRVQVQPAQGVDPGAPSYQKAATACRSLQPQGTGSGGSPLDPQKIASWSKCMRANGMPDFQDPQVNGNQLVIDPQADGINGPDDPAFNKAAQACMSKRPGGMLLFQTLGGAGGGAQ